MSTDYASIVARGVRYLDNNHSGDWRKKISVESLDVASCSVCVLGQIFGDYNDGLEMLGIDSYESKRYGFNTDEDMRALTEAWKDALGANDTLVEMGDVYLDASKCCAIKVVGSDILNIDGKNVTVYFTMGGDLVGDKFTKSPGENVVVRTKSAFERGGSYPVKHVAFEFKTGQFLTNDTGRVYYVEVGGKYGTSREVKDQSQSLYNYAIDTVGLREVKLPGGKLFSSTIVK